MQYFSPQLFPIEKLASGLIDFDVVIDVRSPGEFEIDHIPGALNFPVLNNEERARIGTLYKQDSPFAAKKLGAALVSRNIARHIEGSLLDLPREWRPLIYCWRGGERSGAFTHILTRIGWKAERLESGYQGFRRLVIGDLDKNAQKFSFQVICGMTGCGKTRILQELRMHGAQVLDLEGLAVHRGSVLGTEPNKDQPSQKGFETGLWNALRIMDPSKPVYVESESKKVGSVHIPDALMEKIRSGNCIELALNMDARISWLLAEYSHFLVNPDELENKLNLLISRYGKLVIKKWLNLVQSGNFQDFVSELLAHHYDPAYQSSIFKNFTNDRSARKIELQDQGDEAFASSAKAILMP